MILFPTLSLFLAVSLLMALVQRAERSRIKRMVRGQATVIHPLNTGCLLWVLNMVIGAVWFAVSLYTVGKVIMLAVADHDDPAVLIGLTVMLLGVLLVSVKAPNRYATNEAESGITPWWILAAAGSTFLLAIVLR